MVRVELVPDLSHCVETLARKEYHRLVSQYLGQGQDDTHFEEKVELLRHFLESADFRELRRQSEDCLTKGKKVTFVLCWHEGKGSYRVKID